MITTFYTTSYTIFDGRDHPKQHIFESSKLRDWSYEVEDLNIFNLQEDEIKYRSNLPIVKSSNIITKEVFFIKNYLFSISNKMQETLEFMNEFFKDVPKIELVLTAIGKQNKFFKCVFYFNDIIAHKKLISIRQLELLKDFTSIKIKYE